MKKSLLAIGLALISGCGTTPLIFGRLDVTPALRTACYNVGNVHTDADIQVMITQLEQNRLNGYSKTTALLDIDAACGINTPCKACGVAVINQIYGQ